jgi:DNA helicase-2/ATP-dependent DNA helicase PcrA
LTARRIAVALQGIVPARLVFDGRFFPRGAAQVTIVDEVKGLEFDFVLLPDATQADYPDTPASRRALYVAATRARHQLLLAAVGAPTPLVRGSSQGEGPAQGDTFA